MIHIANSYPQPHIHNPKDFHSVDVYDRILGEKSTLPLYQETFNKKVHTRCSDACGRCDLCGHSYRKKDNSLNTNDQLTSYSRQEMKKFCTRILRKSAITSPPLRSKHKPSGVFSRLASKPAALLPATSKP